MTFSWRKFFLALLASSSSSRVMMMVVTGQEQLHDASPLAHFGGVNHGPYLDWWDRRGQKQYDRSTFLSTAASSSSGEEGHNSTEDGVALHWRVVPEDGTLRVAVAARGAAGGWLAWGISQAGGMLGSDVVLWQRAEPDRLTDAHVIEVRQPTPDQACQDWVLEHVEYDDDDDDDDWIIWEGRRPLVTGDTQDFDIIRDANLGVPATRVIAAWGDEERVAYHGRNVVRGAVRFYATEDSANGDLEEEEEEEEADDAANNWRESATATFFVGADDHVIAPTETRYEHFCFSKADILAQGVPDQPLHVIAFEPVVTPETKKYVHHFVVLASSDTGNDVCQEADFTEMVYVWAPGERPLVLPNNVGGPLFGDSGIAALELEIHYNNPDLDTGKIDSSGVRFYVSDQLREHEIGVLQLGDPSVNLSGQPVGDGLSRHSLSCPGSCSMAALVDEPVTVLREALHMHKSGVRVTNEHFRGEDKIREGSVEVWEFDQQGSANVRQTPFEIQPGDSFRTTCYYRAADGATKTFGLGSQDEMCIAFLFYYPRKLFFGRFPWFCSYGVPFMEVCDSPYEYTLLDSDQDLGRRFGTPQTSEECIVHATPTDTAGTPSGDLSPEPSSSSAAFAPRSRAMGLLLLVAVFSTA